MTAATREERDGGEEEIVGAGAGPQGTRVPSLAAEGICLLGSAGTPS